ncbi:isocitrate/isopropylmalate family dehydrogenase [Pseudoalteromonas sp. T1lg75]|uniref:isocitrate/isopropylmalate family dehydrogenase n=1 Tax=Pseudoalteromonas sp. T1lg75 TaxID=2077102 RepID=UPI000CF6BCAA|nr:isocitrate/isopropylmalate family dehydrogenase [Pseudoalteromonas sp. T1lg75]
MAQAQSVAVAYIDGDGIGPDVMPMVRELVDLVLERCYGGERQIHWHCLLLGEQAAREGDGEWFPQATISALRELKVALKGPMSSAIGGGFRSLNIALREELDLFCNMRVIKALPGLPSALKNSEDIDLVVFRECSEDSFASIELAANSPDAERLIEVLEQELGYHRLRFVDNCALAIKNCSQAATERLIKEAVDYAIKQRRAKITLVHKSNAWQLTEGQFQRWALDYLRKEYQLTVSECKQHYLLHLYDGAQIQVEQMMLDQVMERLPQQAATFDVMVCNNLAGDLLADLAASLVGGVGIVPSVNCNHELALFEPSHGPFRRIAGSGLANPCASVWAAVLMLQHLQLDRAASSLFSALTQVIASHEQLFQLDTRHSLEQGVPTKQVIAALIKALPC